MAVETKNKTGLSLCMLNAVLPGMEVVIIRGHSEKEVRVEISKSLEKNKKKGRVYFRNTKQRKIQVMVTHWIEGKKDGERSNMNARNLETHGTIYTDGERRSIIAL